MLTIASCRQPGVFLFSRDNREEMPQGIKGKVIFKEGNFNSDGEIYRSGKIYAVQRQILVYELSGLKDADIAEGNFVKSVSTEFVNDAISNDKGEFSIGLEPGKYSIFIEENQRLYSPLTHDYYFLPVEIKENEYTEIILEIDYKANYQ